jgi:glycolate oxidase iron-sulfur subunit
MLRQDRDYAEKAAAVALLVRDISEYLAQPEVASAPERIDTTQRDPTRTPIVVAYHAACSLQHGQKIVRQPKELLCKFGFVVKDVPEGHLCCGSAGTYNMLQPELAGRLRDRKVANIASVAPDVIAAGNVGCITQIAGGTAIPVVHPVELIDWATGGPVPGAMTAKVKPRPV